MALARTGPSVVQVMRGIGGLAGVWAGAWAALGLTTTLVLLALMGVPLEIIGPSILSILTSWGLSGFLAGAGFGTLLTIMERRRTLEELSLWRVGVWGALGGLTVSALVLFAVVYLVIGAESFLPMFGSGAILLELVKAGAFGAGSAVGTTALAKSAKDDPE